ncbi:hypothetical protein BB559_003568 [Furculomyces boomerangus]|uniref:Major facilitator superfamily (MFS) profile domain-containing protein n=1 Tax=Furculomyces boomerangus TaxID=61424 RepID=A0A2T9YKL2_9FUNG|nr:hypothetical protein BB559_003568 [Furculomyces boomerangus]
MNADPTKLIKTYSHNSIPSLKNLSTTSEQKIELNETIVDVDKSKTNPSEEGPPPDKGYAWVILGATFINLIFGFGTFNAFGVFQTYYLTVIFVDVPAGQIAWISTLCVFFTLGGGLTAGPIISKLGLRYTSILGSCIAFVGLILASFSTKVWQLALTQGVIFGYGCSLIVNVNVTVTALWFEKHRGLALGVAVSGGGFGALVLVPVVTKMTALSGIAWGFRTLGMLYFVCTFAGGMFLKPRTGFALTNKILDFKLIKDPITILICMIGFTFQIGFTIPVLYFPASLVGMGVSTNLSTNLIMLFCSCSVVCRIAAGYLARRFKPVDIAIIFQSISAISILGIWYTSKSFGHSLAFYIVFGFFSASYIPLGPVIISNHYKKEKISQANGLLNLFVGLATLVGAPSVGAVFQKYGKRTDYSQIIVIGGVSYLISVAFIIALKYYTRKSN